MSPMTSCSNLFSRTLDRDSYFLPTKLKQPLNRFSKCNPSVASCGSRKSLGSQLVVSVVDLFSSSVILFAESIKRSTCDCSALDVRCFNFSGS